MSEKIVQFNEEVINELVRGSVEETSTVCWRPSRRS